MLIGYTFALFIIHTTPTVSYGAFLAPTPPPFFILSTLIPPFFVSNPAGTSTATYAVFLCARR
jgi:hypothetical protein